MPRGKTVRGIQGIAKISILERKKKSLEKELKKINKLLSAIQKAVK